jgi:8-oxo-dGTP pyrophosphatase MutT (NUDIX family)
MAEISIPYPASSVVLVRADARGGFEVYMNRRPAEMDTYAGVYVFPGGRVEKDDWSEKMLALTAGLTSSEAQATLGVELAPELCLGYWVAGVRELFEEAGIHFFMPRRNPTLRSGPQLTAHLAQMRSALQRGEVDFATLLSSQDLCCNLAALVYFYHRVTPGHYRVRFDTRFYLAALPAEQAPLHAPEEVSESLWLSPQDALERFQSGTFPMMPPTLTVLRNLSDHSSWTALQAAFQLR